MLRTTMLRAHTRLLSSSARAASASANFGVMTEKPQSTTAHKTDVKLIASVTRQFTPGTLYDPFDFSMAKIRLERKQYRESQSMRAFDEKKLNPLDFYLEPGFLSQYVSSTGRIVPREVTKLSVKNQKRLAKAIKRAVAAGLMSSVHPAPQKLVLKNNIF